MSLHGKLKKFHQAKLFYWKMSGECDEHYILKENEGKINIYKINENQQEELYETTEISVDYLTEEDKKKY